MRDPGWNLKYSAWMATNPTVFVPERRDLSEAEASATFRNVVVDNSLPPNVWQLRDPVDNKLLFDSRYDSLQLADGSSTNPS